MQMPKTGCTIHRCNYFFLQVLKNGEKIENLMDDNLKTDYGQIKSC